MLKTHPRIYPLVLLVATLLASLFVVACGGGTETKRDEGITVEVAGALPTQVPQTLPALNAPPPLQTQTFAPSLTTTPAPGPTTTLLSFSTTLTPTPASGGKPPTPPASFATTPVRATTTTTAATTPTTVRATMDGTSAPATGRWIDVDVSRYTVRLMNGTEVTRTISPVAVGAQVDTGVYESTQTGTFRVHNKIGGLQYDAPYKTYISDWVGFDAPRANGFHSLLKDGQGNVVDPATGRVSNGCIRVGESSAVFAYAEIGMIVYVHH